MTDDQDRRLPPATSVSTPTERHARASDQHVRRWRSFHDAVGQVEALVVQQAPQQVPSFLGGDGGAGLVG
ncbi:hypothetical protein [Kitasatospora sp. MAP5-34]|uniref:hypothetical protein n=1 Tax=Kitasatospora sp. MAP5-34 TaxID=3035102 RepID=UPI0024761B5A|nr:hypothetical protein [Kitasatospora sp. MAP5-34]MDH6580448.1 hypothetical protein [Kitasatospora sp. MAP5-34]